MSKKIYAIIFGLVAVFALVFALFFCFSGSKKSNSGDIQVIFTDTGNVSQYKTTGFHTPESNLTWIIDNEATVSIPMPEIPDNHDLSMYFETVPFLVEKKLKKQVVDIYANDIFVKKLTLDKSQIYNFTIPLPDYIKNQAEIIIKFKNTTAKSPKELKMSNDTRKYGIALTKLGIAVIDNNNPNRFNEYDIGDNISFDKKGNSTQYVGTGWSMPEKSFTWTDGNDAYLNLFGHTP